MRMITTMLLAFLSFPASAFAQGASGPMVREGATVRLGPNVYAIPDFNVGGVPNVGIVVGERATLVIDPGLGRANGEAILREVAKVSDNARLYIASTHFHPEHTTGYAAFPDDALYVNSTVQEAEFAEDGMRVVQVFAGRNAIMGELLADAERRVADITFEREYSLDLGGVTVHMVVVGPTHTRGDTGFFVEGDRVLFAGDVVMNESFLAANQASSTDAWLAAFDTFERMGPETIVPAHGDIGDGTLISIQRSLVTRVRDRARELKAQGRGQGETGRTIQAELVGEHPEWPRANGIAQLARAAWAEAP